MKTLLIALSSFAIVTGVSLSAHAEGEGQSAPPADPNAPAPAPAPAEPGDAWDQAMRAGMKQEGRQTKDQIVQKEKDEAQEVDNAEAIRKKLRIAAFLGLGGMVGLEQSLDTVGRIQPGGFEFQLGAGIRKGFSLEWEFQGRGLFTAYNVEDPKYTNYVYSSNGNYPSTTSNPGLGLSFDGTARYHFAGVTKPFYFGFGGRVDFIGLSGTHEITRTIGTTPVQKATTSTSLLTVAPLGVAEIGVVLMDAQRVDLSVRVAAGLGFHMGAMAGVAF